MRTLQRPHTVSRGQTGSRYMETENEKIGGRAGLHLCPANLKTSFGKRAG